MEMLISSKGYNFEYPVFRYLFYDNIRYDDFSSFVGYYMFLTP